MKRAHQNLSYFTRRLTRKSQSAIRAASTRPTVSSSCGRCDIIRNGGAHRKTKAAAANCVQFRSYYCVDRLGPPSSALLSSRRMQIQFLYSQQRREATGLSAKRIVESTPSRFHPYLRLMRADRPIGTWLLFWPCTWSIGLATPAGCFPDLKLLGLFGAGAFFMRGAGCIINDLWDKDFDKLVERTKLRPLPSGDLNETQAVSLLAGLLSVSLLILLQLNWCSVFVGASSLALVVSYPLAKRYTDWPQMVLGITLNWGVLISWAHLSENFLTVFPLYCACICYTIIYDTIYSHQFPLFNNCRRLVVHYCLRVPVRVRPLFSSSVGLTFNWGCLLGWAAVRGSLSWAPVFALYLAAISWTLAYDTIYAHQDKTDDIMIGVRSTALKFGNDTKYWLTGFAGLMMSGLTTTGILCHQTWPYYASLGAVGLHLAWQIGTVDTSSAEDCWKKFRSNQILGMILFTGIILGNLLRENQSAETNLRQDTSVETSVL